MTERIVLASIFVGGGHLALRDGFAQSLHAVPGVDLTVWESCDTRTHETYAHLVRQAGPVPKAMFALADSEWVVRALMWKERRLVDEAVSVLKDTQADLIVSTHFMVSHAFALARQRLGLGTRVVSAIPDYGPAPAGFVPRTPSLRPDGCIVMDDSARESLSQRLPQGYPSHLSGFLPRPCFRALSAQRDSTKKFSFEEKQAVVRKLAPDFPEVGTFDLRKPTLAFLGGSAWSEKTWPVLRRVLADRWLLAHVNLIVLAGKNPDFERKAQAALFRHRRCAVVGFVEPDVVASLMALVDVPVLGSLAPATMHELLELGVGPWLVFHTIPGSEAPHVPWMERHHLGLYEPDPSRMVERVRAAVGLVAPSVDFCRMRAQFPDRAWALRRDQEQRAARLWPFLSGLLAQPRADAPSVQN